MKKFRRYSRMLPGEFGATFLEYAMLCALVGIAVAIGVAAFGSQLKELFNTMTGKVKDVNSQMKGK